MNKCIWGGIELTQKQQKWCTMYVRCALHNLMPVGTAYSQTGRPIVLLLLKWKQNRSIFSLFHLKLPFKLHLWICMAIVRRSSSLRFIFFVCYVRANAGMRVCQCSNVVRICIHIGSVYLKCVVHAGEIDFVCLQWALFSFSISLLSVVFFFFLRVR